MDKKKFLWFELILPGIFYLFCIIVDVLYENVAISDAIINSMNRGFVFYIALNLIYLFDGRNRFE